MGRLNAPARHAARARGRMDERRSRRAMGRRFGIMPPAFKCPIARRPVRVIDGGMVAQLSARILQNC
jgi:hypothetical protein